jgi:hypothetical protein
VQRFLIAEQDVDTTRHISNMDLAVSTSSDPKTLTSADWYFYQVRTTENNRADQVFDANYPGNLGYNADALVFTLNMYDTQSGSGGSDESGMQAATPAGAGALSSAHAQTAADDDGDGGTLHVSLPTLGSTPGGLSHVQVESINIADLINGTLLAYRNDVYGTFSLRPTVMHDAVAGDPMWLVGEHGDGQSIDVYKMTNVLSSSAREACWLPPMPLPTRRATRT